MVRPHSAVPQDASRLSGLAEERAQNLWMAAHERHGGGQHDNEIQRCLPPPRGPARGLARPDNLQRRKRVGHVRSADGARDKARPARHCDLGGRVKAGCGERINRDASPPPPPPTVWVLPLPPAAEIVPVAVTLLPVSQMQPPEPPPALLRTPSLPWVKSNLVGLGLMSFSGTGPFNQGSSRNR